MHRNAVLLCLTLALGSAGVANVFGPDGRVPLERTEKPWSAIGYLSSICTGTLVARDLVLTARHCVKGQYGSPLTFYVNGINGRAPAWSTVKKIWKGTGNPNRNRGKDWAILQLVRPLGDTYGWMTVDVPKEKAVQLAGYSQDFKQGMTAGIDEVCEIKQTFEPLIAHDCDGNRGASGGPLMEIRDGVPVLVGLAVSEYRAGGEVSLHLPEFSVEFTNVALSTAAFAADLREARETSSRTKSRSSH